MSLKLLNAPSLENITYETTHWRVLVSPKKRAKKLYIVKILLYLHPFLNKFTSSSCHKSKKLNIDKLYLKSSNIYHIKI
jgi:hypothetical protein